MNTDERIATLESEAQRLIQNTKILVGNLATQAKSALKLNKKKGADYEK